MVSHLGIMCYFLFSKFHFFFLALFNQICRFECRWCLGYHRNGFHAFGPGRIVSSIEISPTLQIGQIDEDRPERRDEYRIQMRKKLLEVMDTNGDGSIDYKEHMDHSASFEGMNDRGWEVSLATYLF